MSRRRWLGPTMVVLFAGVGTGAACGGGGGGSPVTDAASTDAITTDAPATDASEPDAMIDASPSIDASGVDGPQGACNPLLPVGQQGCITGQKCTWIRVQDTPEPLGRLGCVPDGSVALDGACIQGPVGNSTGYDNCAGGLICINSVCKDICGFDGSAGAACASSFVCTRYANLFANGEDDPVAGACNPTCDPVTQLVPSTGGGCGSGLGCYILTSQTSSIAVCASAGMIQPRQQITGQAYANSCVPGAQPRRIDHTSTAVECGGLCRPADVTSTTNTTAEGGVATDSCQTRWGAPAPGDSNGESCRYWWARESFSPPSSFGNTVGWCFRQGAWLYDSNMDTTPDRAFPRCVNLTTGDIEPPVLNPPVSDALYFWCTASPVMFAGTAHSARAWRSSSEPRLDRLAPR